MKYVFENKLVELTQLVPEQLLLKDRPFLELFEGLNSKSQSVQKLSYSFLTNIIKVEAHELDIEEELRTCEIYFKLKK